MLYETFADSRYCTDKFKSGDRDYAAALELAADIANKLNAAYVQAIAARKRSAEDAEDEIKDLLAERAWDEFTALQDLAYENPNVRTLMADLKLSHILLARDPGAWALGFRARRRVDGLRRRAVNAAREAAA